MITPPNTNTSATGGYIIPAPQTPLPGGLTLDLFLQTVLQGVSNLPGNLVRERWQSNPPPQPPEEVDWISFAVNEDDADTYAFNGLNSSNVNIFQRFEKLPVQCSFYGPGSREIAELVRDGLQLGQNREQLQKAGMDFTSTSKMVRVPDLVNERWINRWEMTANFNRQIMRSYPILNFISLSGVLNINDVANGLKSISINVQP